MRAGAGARTDSHAPHIPTGLHAPSAVSFVERARIVCVCARACACIGRCVCERENERKRMRERQR